MSGTNSQFSLERTSEAHAIDEVQAALIADVERQFNELWPSELRPPDALNDLFISVATLVDYTSRTPRGRAQMKERLLRMVAFHAKAVTFSPNDLVKNEHALAVVPGLVAAATGGQVGQPDAGEGAAVAAAVEAWLQLDAGEVA